jgi:hypothetical protein
MINYYFFQFVIQPPGANGGSCSIFPSLDRLGPSRLMDRPCLNRTGLTLNICKTLVDRHEKSAMSHPKRPT